MELFILSFWFKITSSEPRCNTAISLLFTSAVLLLPHCFQQKTSPCCVKQPHTKNRKHNIHCCLVCHVKTVSWKITNTTSCTVFSVEMAPPDAITEYNELGLSVLE